MMARTSTHIRPEEPLKSEDLYEQWDKRVEEQGAGPSLVSSLAGDGREANRKEKKKISRRKQRRMEERAMEAKKPTEDHQTQWGRH